MEDLYLWGTAIIVGLISLKLIPAKKLSAANRRMRARFPGLALAIMYIIICALLFVGAYFLCMSFEVNAIVRNVILGVLLGLFIGFVPIVDKRNAEEDDETKEDNKDEKE